MCEVDDGSSGSNSHGASSMDNNGYGNNPQGEFGGTPSVSSNSGYGPGQGYDGGGYSPGGGEHSFGEFGDSASFSGSYDGGGYGPRGGEHAFGEFGNPSNFSGLGNYSGGGFSPQNGEHAFGEFGNPSNFGIPDPGDPFGTAKAARDGFNTAADIAEQLGYESPRSDVSEHISSQLSALTKFSDLPELAEKVEDGTLSKPEALGLALGGVYAAQGAKTGTKIGVDLGAKAAPFVGVAVAVAVTAVAPAAIAIGAAIVAAGATVALGAVAGGAIGSALGFALGYAAGYSFATAVDALFPVVIDLDGDGVELVQNDLSVTSFDVDEDGFAEQVAWTSPDDAFVVIDLAEDGSFGADGVIDQTRELAFANWTEDEIDTDLKAMATVFDSNGDGVFDENDEHFDDFRIWQDLNQNGSVDEGELKTLQEAGIVSIDLTSDGEETVLADGSVIAGNATYTNSDGEVRSVGDVSLAYSELGYRIVETDTGYDVEFESGESSSFFVNENEEAVSVNLVEEGYVAAVGNAGNDHLDARSNGQSILSGGAGDDILLGGDGNDLIEGGDGNDTMLAGDGNDTVFVDGADTLNVLRIDGGDGYDELLFTTNHAVNLVADDLNFEGVSTGDGNDGLTGISDDKGYIFSSGGGNDILTTAGGSDILDGGAGNDTINAGNGHNIILGNAGNDTITTGTDNDYVSGGEGADNLNSGAGDDILIVDASDTYDAGDGIDRVVYEGDEDLDINVTDNNAEIFYAGSGNDTITTDQRSAAAMYGGAGDDTISGGWGADYLSGDEGNDTLDGGYGSDTYLFGRGFGQDIITDEYVHQGSYQQWYHYQSGENSEWRQRTIEHTEEYNAGDNDTVQFGARINLADLMLRRNGDNLEIAIKDPDNPDAAFDELSDRVTLVNWETENREIETLKFADGSVIRLKDLTSTYGLSDENLIVSELSVAMDALVPDATTDLVIGGTNGDDTLGGQGISETLAGGTGNDVLLGSRGADALDGGDGVDTLSHEYSRSGVNVDLLNGSGEAYPVDDNGDPVAIAPLSTSAGDTYSNIENLTGSAFADTLAGDDLDNHIQGLAGNDHILGNGGADQLDGGEGNDKIEGGIGKDAIDGGEGIDIASYAASSSAVQIDLDAGIFAGGDAAATPATA